MPIFQKTPLRYYADFVVLPISIALLIYKDSYVIAMAPGTWFLLALYGLIGFTFIEYWYHRVILHGVFWSKFHQRHHQRAHEKVIFPWWYMPLTFTLIWLVLPTPLFVGFQVGAMWFFSWHHILHQWDHRKHPWIRQYDTWHDLHHKDLPVNYGITHPLWDMVFGTYCSTAEGHKRLLKVHVRRVKALKPHVCATAIGSTRCDRCFAPLPVETQREQMGFDR